MTLAGFRRGSKSTRLERRVGGWLAMADVRDVDGPRLMGAEYETDTCIADVGGEWIDDCLNTHGGMDSNGPPPHPGPCLRLAHRTTDAVGRPRSRFRTSRIS